MERLVEYLNKKKELQIKLLNLIDSEEDIEEDYQNLIKVLEIQQICEKKSELTEFLNMITKISNNHHRNRNFFPKIEKILLYLKNYIKSNYLNSDIFNIFKSNKRILLFLIKQQMITMTKYIATVMTSNKYIDKKYHIFFAPELKIFNDQLKLNKKIEVNGDLDNFERNRQIGESEDRLCQIIRDDLIEDFISYFNQHQLTFTEPINLSIFETNDYLQDNIETPITEIKFFLFRAPRERIKHMTLIEYAAFFGSVQIFKYLYLNKNELLETELWNLAIHGNNPELIQFLEENDIGTDKKVYHQCLLESIKCHHNDVANYILNNHLPNLQLNQNYRHKNKEIFFQCLKYYNFAFIQNELNDQLSFYYLCKYNYASLVKLLLDKNDMHINYLIILICYLLNDITISIVNNILIKVFNTISIYIQMKFKLSIS